MDSKDIAIASKPYSSGDVILECRPLVHTVKYEFRGICCDFCLKLCPSLKKCSKCSKLFYCGTDCQRKDWMFHKFECPVISKYKLLTFERQGFDYMQRMTLRLYLTAVHRPELLELKYRLHNGRTRSVLDMKSHSKDIESTKPFEGILNYFKLYSIENYDKELVLKLYGILQINAFGIDIYDRKRGICHVASGLYVEASVFDHCCLSNACASGEGLALEIRALRNIEIGEQISIDYVQSVASKSERQTILNQKYYFICRCFRCESDFDTHFDYKKFESLEEQIEDIAQRLDKCKDRKQLLRQFYPHFHPNYTYFLYEYLKLFAIANKNKLAKNQLNKCSKKLYKNLCKELIENIRVTHGLQHNLYAMYLDVIKNNKEYGSF